MSGIGTSTLFRTVTRVLGIALAVAGVLFHRRGLMDWREPVYVLACVALQETFLVLPSLRRLRPYLLAFYLMLPALFVLLTRDRIEPYQGDAVALALHTPLPLMLLPIQLMVLYTREASRLSSLVLVLTLFFVVAGLRRQVDDLIWPWMLVVCTLASLYMAMSYPSRIHLLMFPVFEGRSLAPPVSNPGGLVRGSYFGVMWLAVTVSLLVTVGLFFVMPRIKFTPNSDQAGMEVEQRGPSGGPTSIPTPGTGGSNPGGKRDLSTVSALSDKVELGDFGEIKKSHTVVLEVTPTRVETPQQSGPPIYLRAFTHGVFDGQVWAPLPTAANDSITLGRLVDGKRLLPGARTAGSVWVQGGYKVEILGGGVGQNGELPLVANARALTLFDGPAAYDRRAGVIRAPSLRSGGVYGFDSVELTLSLLELQGKVANTRAPRAPQEGSRSSNPDIPVRAYWLLPDSLMTSLGSLQVVQEVRLRADPGRTRDASPVAAARWLVSWFNGTSKTPGAPKFRYSLVHRPASGDDCVYRFLTKEPFGHCEYFATAMCAVLRASGIPCRLAAGFHASRFNAERGLYEVETANAHAWVELYVEGFGWIAIDPTPASSGESETDPQPVPAPDPESNATPEPENAQTDPSQPESTQGPRDPLMDFDSEAQGQLLEDINSGFETSLEWMNDTLSPMLAWLPGFFPESAIARAGVLAVIPGCLFVVWLWRKRKRRKLIKRVLDEMGLDPSLGSATRRQQGLYLSLLLTLLRYGYRKRHYETPREFAWRVVRRGGAAFEPVRALTEIFYRIRYDVVADQRAEDAAFKRLLSAFAEQLRRAVAETKPVLPPGSETGA